MARTTIGVIADTHDEIVPWEKTGKSVADAFAGVDLILHCGDLTTTAVLDALGEIAPVVAVRSANDPPPQPPRLVDGPTVVEHEGLGIGVIVALPEVEDEEPEPVPATLFGRPVDVVVHGGTHVASVATRDGVLLVNPGSPSLADQTSVARVVVGDGPPEAEIINL
jgi:putative phosphoesterase